MLENFIILTQNYKVDQNFFYFNSFFVEKRLKNSKNSFFGKFRPKTKLWHFRKNFKNR